MRYSNHGAISVPPKITPGGDHQVSRAPTVGVMVIDVKGAPHWFMIDVSSAGIRITRHYGAGGLYLIDTIGFLDTIGM